jgi:hypothetical protein
MTLTANRLHTLRKRLEAFVDVTWPGWAGPDPYDALNSPVLRRLSSRSRRTRIAVTQLMRLLPVDTRAALGIRRHLNPKTLALAASAYVRLAACGAETDSAERRARGLLLELRTHATSRYAGMAWGYSFPWQSRRLWLDRGEPSAVCTAFVARAFLDAFDLWHEPDHLHVAESAAQFLLESCPRYVGQNGICISYVPDSLVLVHNANILAAATLARVWRASGGVNDELERVARQAASFTLGQQCADGSWYYDAGEPRHVGLIDGFHTGFVLEGLHEIQQALGVDYADALRRGLRFYQQRLVHVSGRPRRSLSSALVDIRDCAQAIRVFHRFADFPDSYVVREAVLTWTLRHMLDTRGYFYYEYGHVVPNRLAYPRWQAWMLLALCSLS